MTSKVDKLATRAPRPKLTRRQFIEQTIGRLLLAVALVLAGLALGKALQAVNCINATLGDRGPASKQASLATEDFIDQVVSVLVAPKDRQAVVYAAALPKMRHDRAVLVRVQAQRDAHPLGRC